MRKDLIPLAEQIAVVALGICLTFAILPLASAGQGGPRSDGSAAGVREASPAPAEGALELTELDWFVWDRHDPENSHLMVWVNVTNPGTEPATDIRAEMRGAEPAWVHSAYLATMTGSVQRGGSTSHSFFVLPRTATTVTAAIAGNSPRGSIGLSVESPSGKTFNAGTSGSQAAITIPPRDVNAGAFEAWTATVSHGGGLLGISYSLYFEVEFDDDGAENVTLAQLPPAGNYQLYFNIWADEPYPTLPPNLTIWLNGSVVGEGGPRHVSYVVGGEGPARDGMPSVEHGASDTLAPTLTVATAAVSSAAIVAFYFRATLRGAFSATRLRDMGRKKP